MGELVYLDPWIRRRVSSPPEARTPEDLLLARMRVKRSVGLELVFSHGVTGFVPVGDVRSKPEASLDSAELKALHELVRSGRITRRSDRGLAFARYEPVP